MDISVLASVGSFVVSERVLKPKASVLVLLGCVLCYDLTTKTHDISSLRVYRGPGLLAFALLMVAYSLRTWRRNGVACDELLFLPGTPHGDSTESSENASSSRSLHAWRNEGDVAAGGVGPGVAYNPNHTATTTPHATPQPQLELSEQPRRIVPTRSGSRARSLSSGESSLSSIQDFVNQWEEDAGTHRDGDDNDFATTHRSEDSNEAVDEEQQLRQPLHPSQVHATNTGGGGEADPHRNGTPLHTFSRVDRFRENHPNVTRIGSFFFFRSSTSTTHSAAYAPSGPSVVGAAIDLSMPVLFNFHLFIEAWNHLDDATTGETPAKILPLIFLTVLIVRTVFPPGRRGRFWATMKVTAMAPLHKSRFRDSYIGDLLTSLVRPLQDVVFALAYYVTVIYGSVTSKYDLTESGLILESSWWLHQVVLPTVALLPLWWRFLQTLREAYDAGQRWPYLGNAFKYLSAALVILYAMHHDDRARSLPWLGAFLFCLLYQIFWDTVMDWDLLVLAEESADKSRRRWFRALQIRPRRLYKTESFYWKILGYNTIFRFCWMLSFIPSARHGTSDTHSYVGVLLPIAEIVRRMVWGFLFLERHTMQMGNGESEGPPFPVERSNRLWVAELSLWAVAFVVGGIWVSS